MFPVVKARSHDFKEYIISSTTVKNCASQTIFTPLFSEFDFPVSRFQISKLDEDNWLNEGHFIFIATPPSSKVFKKCSQFDFSQFDLHRGKVLID